MPYKDANRRKEYDRLRQHTPIRIEQRKKYQQGINGKKTRMNYEKSLKGKAARRDYQLKHRYGTSLENYNRLFEQQLGKCAICGIHQSMLRRSLDLDHSHITGKIRGLLCERHNKAIGFFNDSVDDLRKTLVYIEKYEEKL
jgi:hypothetical protein